MAEMKGSSAGDTTSPGPASGASRSAASPGNTTHLHRPSGAVTHRGPMLNSWMDGTLTSPRTPRQHLGERVAVAVAVAELQRSAQEERRQVQRQMEHLERRMQEHLTAPAANRERWADLQGSVSGLLEEVANLVRRVEALDEKLRIRTTSCEELLRQRSRELEQQLHGQQQKVQLAVSTFEEMSKRQTAKLRKVLSASEEQARKMSSLEDLTRRTQMGPATPLEAIQARLSELEGQQASLEEEFRHVTASTAVAQAISPRHAPRSESDREDSVARLLESELAKLSKQLATQLDEHAAALANLRVRTESQEQRLSTSTDRWEKVMAPSLEALRGEMQQLRLADRQETEQRVEHLERQLKDFSDSYDEVLALKDQAASDHKNVGFQEMQQMRETCAMQEDQLQRVMAYLDHQGGGPAQELDLPEVLFRVEGLENRLDSFNQDDMAQKADRSELHRLDLALEELQQPLRRLSQRTASNEARTTALEHHLEQLQGKLASQGKSPVKAGVELQDLQAVSDQMAEILGRVTELEEIIPQLTTAKDGNANEVPTATAQSASRGERTGPSVASNEVHSQLEEMSTMCSKAMRTAECSASNMQALRFDLVVEQERVAKLSKDLQGLAHSFRDGQSKVQSTAERQEDQEQRTKEALSKMMASIEKVQGLQHGYEGGTSALNKLLESIAKRVEAAEAALASERDQGPSATEVHLLRDELKADLLETFEQRLLSAQGSSGSEEDDLVEVRSRAEEALQLAKTSHEMCETLRADLMDVQSRRSEDAEQLTKAIDAAVAQSMEQRAPSKEAQPDLTRKLEELEQKLSNKVVDVQTIQTSMATEIKMAMGEVSAKVERIAGNAEALRTDLDDALQRVEASEEASKAVREELMAEDQHEAYTLARTCHNDLRGVHSDVADLQAALRRLVAAREAPAPSRSEAPKGLESRVLELQKQVTEELDQLTKQQQIISKVGMKGGKIDTQDLEKNVNSLAAQVSHELTELRAHQGELGKVHQLVMQRAAGKDTAVEVEKKVQELQKQVMTEVEALTKQQAELGKTQVTLSELSERVKHAVMTADECKEATSSLEERLKSLSAEEVCPKCGTGYFGAGANYCRNCGHKRGDAIQATSMDSAKPQVTIEESDESYADEFEVDDMSVSEKLTK